MLVAVLLPLPAAAAWPDDVVLSGMTTFGGVEVLDRDTLAADYRQVVAELGAGIAHAPLPPYTLGARGFEVAGTVQMFFKDVYPDAADQPAAWERVHPEGDPEPFLVTPGLVVRKGLPFSVELGFQGAWVAATRQGVLGGWARVALVEQDKPYPDVALHLGYTGYIGNDELELGTLVFGGTLGSLFRVGPKAGMKAARITPYLDISLLAVYAAPVLPVELGASIGASAFGAASPDPAEIPAEAPIALARFSGGLEVVAGSLLIRLTGGYTLGARAYAAVALGFNY
ncbi:MAG: hypothetical protein H6732_17620 [Alphaproteobacteria bacterium]|nr:hypothetical protein [Alphaproteobacteria bacterium]